MSGLRISLRCFLLPVLILISSTAHSSDARLVFSDLITGPDTGLNDGHGSGVIVTVWGYNLGSVQGDSTAEFCDAASVCRSAYVYYWKNSDGNLPGGPANLFASHGMQEVALSIPDSALGLGEIKVTVDGVSSSLPFTVRSGEIFHVKLSGNDSNNGSFSSPWRTVGAAENAMNNPGATLYIHDSIVSGSPSTHRAIYWNNVSAASGLANQMGFIAYPNSQPQAIGYSGFINYRTAGQVVSKFKVFASECEEGPNGQPQNCASSPSNNVSYGIQASAYGRAVGNAITDRPGGCADGTQGAISGNLLSGDRVSGYQILGNEIYDYGCEGSSKLHHTTYMSVRSAPDNIQVDPWRFGWNYLHDNKAKNGIHQYDERSNCGSPNSTVVINDNVIINQGGAGIAIGANCAWTNDFDVYNNIVINAGLAIDWDGIDPATANGPNTSGIAVIDGGLTGTVNIYNNTIHTWNNDDPFNDARACIGLGGTKDVVSVVFSNNVCYTNKDKPFVHEGCCGAEVQLDNISGSNNAWYYSGQSPTEAVTPNWDLNGIEDDPKVSISGVKIIVGPDSPIISNSNNTNLLYDIYGNKRLPGGEIGAVEFDVKPNSPSGLTVN